MSTMKKVLALTLALVMALSFASFGYTDSADVDAKAAEAVKLLSAVNVITGYTDDTFRPNGYITRAEAAKMIYVICNRGVDDKAAFYAGMESQFTDVPNGIWYEGYVNYCASIGIIAGRSATTFDPQANVTGYELAKMLLVVAEYRPEVQGYGAGATDWQNCVYRDAYQSYMLQDVNALMTQPISRQWAAKMMYNTLLNVNVAAYVGDLLVTGNLGGSGSLINSLTVGEKRMGLDIVTGVVIAANNVKLGGMTGDANITVDVDGVAENLVFAWEADEALLGHQVKVVLKETADIDTGVDFNEGIYGVYGMYETGKTKVYNTTVGAITYTDTTTDTIKFAGFNSDKAKAHSTLPVVYFNNYETRATVDAGDEFATYFGRNSADPVVAVDTTGNGTIDYMFVTETVYGVVVRNNGTSKFIANDIRANNVYGISSNAITIAKAADYGVLNFIDEVKVGDVIAITPNYLSSELVYDIEVVEPTTVTASDWTYYNNPANSNYGEIEKVKLDGTYYAEAAESLNSFDELDQQDVVYYLHNGYVVTAAAEALANVPANVAVILDVNAVDTEVTDVWGNSTYPVTVKYLAQDGKTYVRNYAVPTNKMSDNTIIGATANVYSGSPLYSAANTSNDALRTYLTGLEEKTLVEYVDDGTNVYFRMFAEGIIPMPAGAAILRSGGSALSTGNNVDFVKSTGMLEIDGRDLETTEDTYFFVNHKNSSAAWVWSIVKASDFIGNFEDAYAADIVMMADFSTPYGMLKMENLPAAAGADMNLAQLTGGYVITKIAGTKHTTQLSAKDMNGENMTLTVILDAAATGEAGKTDVKGWVAAMKGKIVGYTPLTDGTATLHTVPEYVATLTNHSYVNGDVLNLTSNSFRVGSGNLLYFYDKDTVVVTVAPDATGAPAFTYGAGDDMLIADDCFVVFQTVSKVENAKFVLVNLMDNSITYNYDAFIATSIPAVAY